MIESYSFSSISQISWWPNLWPAVPAKFAIPSILPNVFFVDCRNVDTADQFVMSTVWVISLLYCSSLRSRRSFESPSWFVSHMPKRAPRLSNMFAVARPIPDAPPVIMKTLPATDDMFVVWN